MDMKTIRRILGELAADETFGRRARAALNALDGVEPKPVRRAAPPPARPLAHVAIPTLAELEAKIAKFEAEMPKSKMLAARPDLSPTVVKQLRQMPPDVVRSFLDAHPAPLPTLSSASSGIGLRSQAAHMSDPDALRDLMGLPSLKPGATFDGVRHELRTLTREEAQAMHDARTKGSV